MEKSKTLSTRVSSILADRLENYIKNENRSGRSVDQTSVVIDAVVEYLDKHEQRLPLSPGQLNDRDIAYLRKVLREESSDVRQLAEEAENASLREHEAHDAKRAHKHIGKPPP